MNMLVVLGNPRGNGNSETLAAAVVAGFSDTLGQTEAIIETIRLNALTTHSCQVCGGRAKTGRCAWTSPKARPFSRRALKVMAMPKDGPTYWPPP